jgi:hypothetical protein
LQVADGFISIFVKIQVDMRRWYLFPLLMVLFACGEKKFIPDITGIEAPLSLQRFEQSFFTLDTTKLDESLLDLTNEYRGFPQDFLFNIMGTRPDAVRQDIPTFIRSYQPLWKEIQAKFKDMTEEVNTIQYGLKMVKYYFAEYKLPERVITFIGPLNSYGSIITPDGLAVGLQLYLGADHPVYQSEEGQQMYPKYISRRFDRAYIPVNAIKNIIDDLYPPNYADKPLVEQMIEAGKRLYLLDQFLPETADTLKTGYTAKQLEGCLDNEKNIWSFFIQNNLLYIVDPEMVRDYMSDAPNTTALGEASPGFIGQFVGWQIVKKWMVKQKDPHNLMRLMETSAKKIFEEAKYKP